MMYHNNFFTDEQWECIRVCVANAPIPNDISCDADMSCTFDYIKHIKWHFDIVE